MAVQGYLAHKKPPCVEAEGGRGGGARLAERTSRDHHPCQVRNLTACERRANNVRIPGRMPGAYQKSGFLNTSEFPND